jgi:NAD+ synthase (glutamine-hydrolysing)
MYAVNSSIPKTLVRYLVDWVANTQVDEITRTILMDILDTPVSPELLPPDLEGNIIQKTEEVVGPYELHDFFLYNVVRFGFSPKKIYYIANLAFSGLYEKEIILYWLKTFYKRFFSQQFKRSCLPDGPKVGSICLSPRGDWRMPSDAAVNLWMDELNTL